jgi:glutaredoxin-like YruB-family protein
MNLIKGEQDMSKLNEQITVYTQPDCPPCKIVKQFLDHHQLSYEVLDITKNAKAKEELIHKYNSFSTPTVVVGNEVVAGFDLQKLEVLLNLNNK